MTVHSRRALRVTATLAGVAALGSTFSGTAFAADQGAVQPDGADQDNSVRNDSDRYSDAYLGDTAGDTADEANTRPADLAVGPMQNLGLLDFALPTAGPSLAPAKKKKDDDDNVSNRNSTGPHHYYPGSREAPYDFDLYNPLEVYGGNQCKDKGADRAPLYATEGGFGGFNGQSARGCKVDSGDYEPEDTAYKGKSGGYSGYLGTDRSRQ